MLVVVNVPAAAPGASEAILDNVSDISEGDIPELAEAEEEDDQDQEMTEPPTTATLQAASAVVDMDTTTAATSFVDISTTATTAAARSIITTKSTKATNGHDASGGGAPQEGGGANTERVSVVRTSTMSAILTARGAAAAAGMSREDIEEISDEEAEWSDDVETAGYGDFEPMDLLLSSMSGGGEGGDNMAELQTVRVLDAASVAGWDLKPLTALCSPTETLFDAVSRGKAVVDRPQGGGVVEADMMMEQQKAAGPGLAELLARLTATAAAAAAGDERWVDSIETAAALLQEELPALLLKNGRGVTSSSLVEVSLLGLDYKAGACLPRPAHQVRHVKAGLRFLLEALSCDDDTFDSLIGSDVQQQLLALYGQPFMTVPTKLLVLRVLDRTLDRASGMAGALRSGDVNYRSVYQQLLNLLKEETKTRIKFALKSIMNKFHLYEMLMRLSELAAFPQSSFGEIEHLLRQLAVTYSSLDTAMSHPARFLPCSQQWELDPAAQAADSRPERGYFALADQAGLLAALVALLTAADTQHSAGLAAAIQDLLQLWLDTEAGLMYLAAGGPATSALIRALLETEVITKTTAVKGAITSEEGTPSGPTTTTTTAGTVLGLELAAMMQATQQVDVLTAAVRAAAERQDMEARPVLAAVQLLYGLTASGPGKRAVVHVLTLGRHLEAGLEKTRVFL